MKTLRKTIAAIILGAATIGCGACTQEISSEGETAAQEETITWSDCSYEQGDHACDFTLTDQNGQDWNLYEHHGTAVLLDFSTMWCGYCQVAAAEIREVQEAYAGDIIYVTILIENQYGQEPDVDDLDGWASIFGITNAPVLGGDRSLIESPGNEGWEVAGWPTFYFLTDELVNYTSTRGFSSTTINTLIQDTIAQ